MWTILQGAGTSGTGNIVPALPVGWAANDIHILTVETQQTESVAAPAGWTAVPSSPQTGADTKIHQFWRRAVGGDTAPTVVDPGDHAVGFITGIRGATTSGSPFRNNTGNVQAASTNVTLDAVAADAGDLVGLWFTVGRDSATSPLDSSALVNADLTVFARPEGYSTQGNGGGICGHLFAAPNTANSSGTAALSASLATAHLSWSMVPDGSDVNAKASRVMLGTVVNTRGGGDKVAASRIMLGIVVQTAGPEVIRRRRVRTFYP